jgi:hypothetical protein
MHLAGEGALLSDTENPSCVIDAGLDWMQRYEVKP